MLPWRAERRAWGEVTAALPGWIAEGLRHGLFQTPAWLDAVAALAAARGGETAAVLLWGPAHRHPALVLPVVRHRRRGIRRIEPFDEGLVDYVLPLVDPAAPWDALSPAALRRLLIAAMPAGDLFAARKMPADMPDLPNPLLAEGAVRPDTLTGHVVRLDNGIDAYRASLPGDWRKEMGRIERVFDRLPGARYREVTDADDGIATLEGLAALQRDRITGKGWDYRLDAPEVSLFYRRLLLAGLRDGHALLARLDAEGTMLAAALAFRNGPTLAIVRLGVDTQRHAQASPGRVLLQRMMASAHAKGVTAFDMTIGDYPYKRRFAPSPRPLYRLRWPLSPLGRGLGLMEDGRAALARQPMLRRLAGRS